jgi:hypothetical protein
VTWHWQTAGWQLLFSSYFITVIHLNEKLEGFETALLEVAKKTMKPVKLIKTKKKVKSKKMV